jgi:hypothetical protein
MVKQKFGTDTLLIIPCCAKKEKNGNHIRCDVDPLQEFISPQAYSVMLAARTNVLKKLKDDAGFVTKKYQKNDSIQKGADLGGSNSYGFYLTALERYDGTLYSIPGLKQTVKKVVSSCNNFPKIIILSALYGPLHPFSQVQDYNLEMKYTVKEWQPAFQTFLADYVSQNGINQIVSYLGSTTAYFRVVKQAVLALNKDWDVEGIQYHVENGNTRRTPLQHGLRLLEDLDAQRSEGCQRSVGIIENVFRPRHHCRIGG